MKRWSFQLCQNECELKSWALNDNFLNMMMWFDLEMVCFDWLIMGKTAEMLLLYVKFNRIWQHIQTWRPIQEVKNKWVLSWLIWQLHVSYKAPPSFPYIPIRYPKRPWSRIKWIKKTLFFFMKLELRNAATVNIFFRLLNQWDYWVSL